MLVPNQTQAALNAGFSPRTAGAIAHNLMQDERVVHELAKRQAKRAIRTGISAERVLREAARIAFADMKNYGRWDDGKLVLFDSDDLDDDDSAAISEVTQTPTKYGTQVKIKLHPKQGSIDLITKHLGLVDNLADFANALLNPFERTDQIIQEHLTEMLNEILSVLDPESQEKVKAKLGITQPALPAPGENGNGAVSNNGDYDNAEDEEES